MKATIVTVLTMAMVVGLFGVGPYLDQFDKQKSEDQVLQDKIARLCGENAGYIWTSNPGEVRCTTKKGRKTGTVGTP